MNYRAANAAFAILIVITFSSQANSGQFCRRRIRKHPRKDFLPSSPITIRVTIRASVATPSR